MQEKIEKKLSVMENSALELVAINSSDSNPSRCYLPKHCVKDSLLDI